jgi:glutamyl-tRNA reductase
VSGRLAERRSLEDRVSKLSSTTRPTIGRGRVASSGGEADSNQHPAVPRGVVKSASDLSLLEAPLKGVEGEREPARELEVVGAAVDFTTATGRVLKRGVGSRAATAELLEESRLAVTELVLLSTCNRIEMFAAHPDPEEATAFLHRRLESLFGPGRPEIVTRRNEEVVRHLVATGSGLTSPYLGEHEILHQLREAYVVAAAVGTAATVLGRLFEHAIHHARLVRGALGISNAQRSLTDVAWSWLLLRSGRAPIASAAVVGAGEIARQVAERLPALGLTRLLIFNRDLEKAHELARKLGAQPRPLASLRGALGDLDLLVLATSSHSPILSGGDLPRPAARAAARGELAVIDFGVPGNLSADSVPDGVSVLAMPDIVDLALAKSGDRGLWIDRVEPILENAAAEFMAWHRLRRLGPAVRELQSTVQETIASEVMRSDVLGDSPDRAAVDRLARRLSNKLLHPSLEGIREIAAAESSERAEEIMRSLFLRGGSPLVRDGGK